MSTKDDEFLKQLRATFKVEADEHLQAIAAGLLELERTSESQAQRQIVETVFRAAHSLKGAARAVDLTAIESLCQSLEDVFAAWKRQESAPSSGVLDTLHRKLDAIAATLAVREPSSDTGMRVSEPSIEQPVRHTELPAPTSITEQGNFSSGETVRVAVAKLEAQLLEAEEMVTAKLAAGQRAADLRELAACFGVWRNAWAATEQSARQLRQPRGSTPAYERLDALSGLTTLLDFFEWSMDYLKSVESKAAALERAAEHDRHAVGKLVDDLLEDSKKLLLLPFSTISAAFPKLVRDLSRDQGKEAEFTIRGDEVEIDKRILEEMKDPLIHLLRNSIDHGVEPPGERILRGKPSRAAITLTVTQVNGNRVQLLISDDGAGIDTARVRESAVKRGLVTAEAAAALGETEIQALIFRSGISASPIITSLSGRGLGLAIVREKAEKLGGTISIESRQGQGTAFRIILPTTRATFRGILVEAAGRLLVVPAAQAECVTRARPDEVQTVEGRETISINGRVIALVRLADALELAPVEWKETPDAGFPVIILGGGEQEVAFAVDAVLDEQEVLVRPLVKPLSRVRNIAAATVLGSGKVAPILNVADLLRSARNIAGAAKRTPAGTAPAQTATRTILVAEDSITSRMLLKGILESAGYKVKVAVDGMEAFTLLRAEKFDLVVSDVEMPRLDGFDLTARIRADRKLAELPVVLVTALETREDRERGIDVGANAYLVKSSFDQSNLLEAVRRLI